MSRRRQRSSRRKNISIGTIISFILVVIFYFVFGGGQNTTQSGQPGTTGNAPPSQAAPPQSSNNAPRGESSSVDLNLALGNISDATTDTSNADNYLIMRKQYALSYNRDAGIPNWVSWHLSAADLGTAGRSDFQPDTSLPKGWYEVKPSDYTSSGYDRGHMAPSADRTASQQDNAALFLMSNIVPQAPDNNQGPWAELEDYCRGLVRQGDELYIVSGVSGKVKTIAKGHLVVPKNLWKVIVVLPEGNDDLARIDDSTTVIAVELPNKQGVRNTDWQHYLTTVDKIEQETGYDFLSNVDPKIQAKIESVVATP